MNENLEIRINKGEDAMAMDLPSVPLPGSIEGDQW
jgi:hypothetical protein